MNTIHLSAGKETLDFAWAKALANATAAKQLEEPVLLSWFDKIRNLESPRGVSECHDACDIPGCVEYAANREGKLVVDIDQGNYLFCYRELGEFA